MIKLINKTGTTTTDADYPLGKITNNPGDNSGNELDENFFNDYVQAFEKAFDVSGLVANGLPDNDVNDYQMFKAMQIAMRPYKAYSALLSQAGTAAPTVESIDADGNANSPLENSLSGLIVWSYSNVGEYIGTLAAAFVDKKTFLLIRNESNTIISIERFNANSLLINTRDNAGTLTNGLLTQTSVEIRVYR